MAYYGFDPAAPSPESAFRGLLRGRSLCETGADSVNLTAYQPGRVLLPTTVAGAPHVFSEQGVPLAEGAMPRCMSSLLRTACGPRRDAAC